MTPEQELPPHPNPRFPEAARETLDAKTPNVRCGKKGHGVFLLMSPLLDLSPINPNFGLGGQTRHQQHHAGDTHPVPAAPGHPHHRDPMGSPSEHPDTFLCLWGSPASAERGNDVSCKFAGGHKSFNPIRPCAVGDGPSSHSIFHQNLDFYIQLRAKCCQKRGEGDPWDHQQFGSKNLSMRIFQET